MTETFKLVSRRRLTHFLATPVWLLSSAAVKLRFRFLLRNRISVWRFFWRISSISTGSRKLICPTEDHFLLLAVRLTWPALSLTNSFPISDSFSISDLAIRPSTRSSLIAAPLRCHRSRLQLVQAGKQFSIESSPPLCLWIT
jgi:hypothetical protein